MNFIFKRILPVQHEFPIIFMMRKYMFLLLCGTVILLASCSVTPYSDSEFMMDTQCVITVYKKSDLEKLDAVFEALRDFEKKTDRYEEGSEVSLINRYAGISPVRVSEDVFSLIAKAKEMCSFTCGAFNPLLGRISDMWNFNSSDHHIPSSAELACIVLAASDISSLVLDEEKLTVYLASDSLSLDLGGIAKGYASTLAASMLENMGIERAIINLGGNVYAVGSRSPSEGWRIGLQDPQGGGGSYFTVVNACDEAVVTSGAYQRYFISDGVAYHHILDPSTGYPADSDLESVSVISSDGTLADALSTALFVMGSVKAESFCSLHGIKAVLLSESGEISYIGFDSAES